MTEATDNPGYVDSTYLETIIQLTHPVKQRSYELMRLAAGQKVLDVGCGPATDTIPLTDFVSTTGQVVGIDCDEEMIRVANQKAEQAGVASWVRHDHAEVPPLPYETNSFDAARSERVFQHIAEPAQLLAEMLRVTKSGGWVVVADTDHSSISVDCPDPELTDIEWRLRRYRTEMFVNGYSGRQLYRLFKANSLRDVTVEFFPFAVTNYELGRYFGVMDEVEQRARADEIVTDNEIQLIHEMYEQADKAGIFFGYALMLVVSGRKP